MKSLALFFLIFSFATAGSRALAEQFNSMTSTHFGIQQEHTWPTVDAMRFESISNQVAPIPMDTAPYLRTVTLKRSTPDPELVRGLRITATRIDSVEFDGRFESMNSGYLVMTIGSKKKQIPIEVLHSIRSRSRRIEVYYDSTHGVYRYINLKQPTMLTLNLKPYSVVKTANATYIGKVKTWTKDSMVMELRRGDTSIVISSDAITDVKFDKSEAVGGFIFLSAMMLGAGCVLFVASEIVGWLDYWGVFGSSKPLLVGSIVATSGSIVFGAKALAMNDSKVDMTQWTVVGP